MSTRLEHKTALVTGAISNIGRAIATAFAAEGAHVIVCGRSPERGAEVVEQIHAARRAVSLRLDGAAPNACPQSSTPSRAGCSFCPVAAGDSGAGEVEIVTASRRRRSLSLRSGSAAGRLQLCALRLTLDSRLSVRPAAVITSVTCALSALNGGGGAAHEMAAPTQEQVVGIVRRV